MDKSTLTSMMPDYYQTSTVVDSLNGADAAEINKIAQRFDAVANQFFVQSADFSLERWEQELGIEINNNYDKEFRRSRIISKLRGQGTVTVKLIKNVSESFADSEVNVIEHNEGYKFTIKFVGIKGVPPNMNDLRKALEDCKPAHLAFDFEYTYNTHGALSHYTHAQLAQWTHLTLREGNLV